MTKPSKNRTSLLLVGLIALGVLIGVAAGLLLGWVVWPVKYFDTSMADLHQDYKAEYAVLVGAAYLADGNLDHAQVRLEELDLPNTSQWIADLTDRFISEGRADGEIQALAALASAFKVDTPRMAAYLATPTYTPLPTSTPTDTPTATYTPSPTATPSPTDTPVPATDTLVPPTATDTPAPQPTDTPGPPTNTPTPRPTNTPRPPTATPTPTVPPVKWTITEQRLVRPGEDGQGCEYGNLQIRVTVLDAGGNQINGVWLYDGYSQQYMVTGNVDSPDWGPGETKYEYGIHGGGRLCIATGQGGECESDWTRSMPCYDSPPFEDIWAAGYCECCYPGITKEACQALYNDSGNTCVGFYGHYSWRVKFQRSW
jgi:hypothetical protein